MLSGRQLSHCYPYDSIGTRLAVIGEVSLTGCSWVDVDHLMGGEVSDTTLRHHRDGWVHAAVFDRLVDEALCVYDKVIGLDLSEVAVDGSLHKAPYGGEGAGKGPTDRGKHGWKWSLATERSGIPIGWATDAASRNDSDMFPSTMRSVNDNGLLNDLATLHLDLGYDNSIVRSYCQRAGIDDMICAKRKTKYCTVGAPRMVPLGLR